MTCQPHDRQPSTRQPTGRVECDGATANASVEATGLAGSLAGRPSGGALFITRQGADVEQADTVRPEMAAVGNERAYERYGWMILSASALLGIVAAVVTTLPPHLLRSGAPSIEGVYPIMGALGAALVGFNILALVVSPDPLQEVRAVGLVHAVDVAPLMWLSQFVLCAGSTPIVVLAAAHHGRPRPALPRGSSLVRRK